MPPDQMGSGVATSSYWGDKKSSPNRLLVKKTRKETSRSFLRFGFNIQEEEEEEEEQEAKQHLSPASIRAKGDKEKMVRNHFGPGSFLCKN